MTDRSYVDRAVLGLTSALRRIAESGDCDRAPEDDEGPCDCPVHVARATLEHDGDWRFRGHFWERVVLRPDQWPSEARAVVAWRAFMTRDSADSADAKLTEIMGRPPTASDWWVATSVLQWLHTNVGSSILSTAGWRYHEDGEPSCALAGPPFGRVRDPGGVVHRTGWVGRRARLCNLQTLVSEGETTDAVTCPACLLRDDADRDLVAEGRARLAQEADEGRAWSRHATYRLLDRLEQVLDEAQRDRRERARLDQSIAAALGRADLASPRELVDEVRRLREQVEQLTRAVGAASDVAGDAPGTQGVVPPERTQALRCQPREPTSRSRYRRHPGGLRAWPTGPEVCLEEEKKPEEAERLRAIERWLEEGGGSVVWLGELSRAREEARRVGWTTPSARAVELAGQLATLVTDEEADVRTSGWTTAVLREVSDLLFAAYGERSLTALEHATVGILAGLAQAALAWRSARRAVEAMRLAEARARRATLPEDMASTGRERGLVAAAEQRESDATRDLEIAVARIVP